jgi:hypothetical protein
LRRRGGETDDVAVQTVIISGSGEADLVDSVGGVSGEGLPQAGRWRYPGDDELKLLVDVVVGEISVGMSKSNGSHCPIGRPIL